jgi:predicted TIM-barrel fold metal-dependent hydrolase
MEAERQIEFFGGGWRTVKPTEKESRSQVIDVHTHVFRRLGSGAGLEEEKLSLKLWQYHVRDFTDFWRKKDGIRVTEALLDFPSDSIDDMPDVDFRMGSFGQAEFTVDGVDYYMQLFPPSLENLEATPERMIAEMNVSGVDMGVLQSDHVYGSAIQEYYAEVDRRYPGRFIGLAQIRESEAGHPSQLEQLERAVHEQGCRGLYFSVELFSLDGYVDHIDDAKFEPLWETVSRLDIPVFWFLDPRKRDRVAGFLECVADALRWAEAHPDIPAVLTHGPVPAAIIHDIGIPERLWTLLKRPNMHVEMLMQAKFSEYPYPEGQEMLRRFRDELGIEKLMWGSDMPFGSMWCTYRQAVDYVRLHCDFFSQEEKDLFLGGNVARVLGL